jgi:hypothetical protein
MYLERCSNNVSNCVGLQVLRAVVMKSSIFWDTPPHSPLKVNRRLEGTCRDRRINQARNWRESRWQAEPTLKIVVTRSSETSVDFQQTIWRYIPVDT